MGSLDGSIIQHPVIDTTPPTRVILLCHDIRGFPGTGGGADDTIAQHLLHLLNFLLMDLRILRAIRNSYGRAGCMDLMVEKVGPSIISSCWAKVSWYSCNNSWRGMSVALTEGHCAGQEAQGSCGGATVLYCTHCFSGGDAGCLHGPNFLGAL